MGLRVGLDVGIASVGWAVLDTEAEEIMGAGVRVFPAAENPKTGASLAAPRREARAIRRRLRRRRARMQEFRDLVVSSGILPAEELTSAFAVGPHDETPYALRAEALDRQLSAREWTRVLSQLCKRRGYKSMRLSETESDDEGVVRSTICANDALMHEKGYRTVGEMILKDKKFAASKRNKGDYKGVVSREQLLDEIAMLFEAQRTYGNPHATPDIERRYLDTLNSQAPIKEGDDLLELVGTCSIDRTNKRIPVACHTFERFRAIDKLNNIRYRLSDGSVVALDAEQKAILLSRMFQLKSAQSYERVRATLRLPDDARFIGVRYDNDGHSSEQKEKLPFPKAWNAMRDAARSVSDAAWAELAEDSQKLDMVGTVLTYYKYEESVSRELTALGLDADIVRALSTLRFSKNGHLSRETLLAILPYMEAGLSYPDACAAAGFHHSARTDKSRHAKLPPIPADEIRNPVVVRALSQTRKVLNAILSEFGAIEALNIELGRDVARSRRDRDQMDRDNKKRRDFNEEVLADLRSAFGMTSPKGHDLVKHKLWKEQGGRCAYSGMPINPTRLFSGEPGVAEVDHILPHARSFDDSYMNKVLVTTAENRNKGERTPFEYLGADPQRWHLFEERVESMHLPRPKRERLLRKEFDERASEEFRERNLNDTRYIARFLKNFIADSLQFAGEHKVPVMTINGRATAYLRNAWTFQKVRAEGDLHHAMDAIVIAAADRSMIQKISRFFSVRPLRSHEGTYYVPHTGEIIDAKHVPEPWNGFREQASVLLNARFSDDPVADLESPGVQPKPILVSRMPSRAVRGEVHKETVRRLEGADEKGLMRSSKKVRLEDLTTTLLERMVGAGQDRALFEALKERLDQHDGDGAKAFAEPLYKPTRAGRPAPQVRSIRVYDKPSSGGVLVRGGLADNGAMVRTDVFERDGKFYLVPVYLEDVTSDELPTRAIVQKKPERDWRQIDDSYRFVFSLYMNDLVRLVKRSGDGADIWFGYFKGTNRSDGGVDIQPHESTAAKTKKLGVAQGVISFDKYEVDVLGRGVHRVRRERRRGFSNRGDSE